MNPTLVCWELYRSLKWAPLRWIVFVSSLVLLWAKVKGSQSCRLMRQMSRTKTTSTRVSSLSTRLGSAELVVNASNRSNLATSIEFEHSKCDEKVAQSSRAKTLQNGQIVSRCKWKSHPIQSNTIRLLDDTEISASICPFLHSIVLAISVSRYCS